MFALSPGLGYFGIVRAGRLQAVPKNHHLGILEELRVGFAGRALAELLQLLLGTN